MILEPQQVMEGAGVRLRRSIGSQALNYLDPFLLLDHFSSDDPDDYRAGFPLHPHRGIETVTYMLQGVVHHRDTLGNSGAIGAGEVQWMTAAGGIMHEEMPQVRPEGNHGFQLWVNLPAKLKMTRPRYRGIAASEIPEIEADGGATVKIIAGSVGDTTGAVHEIAADPTYLDVKLPSNSSFTHQIPMGHAAFAYVFEGRVNIGDGTSREAVEHLGLAVLTDGDFVTLTTSDSPARLLLVSGKPLNEPIARYGPFVMNTREEIHQALRDLEAGTFVWTEDEPRS
jgi:redox-sensitive bicupin YhaK (pirin superfamily)